MEIKELNTDWSVEGFARGIGLGRGAHLATYKSASAVPAVVPGTVRRALINAGLIPDPYYGEDNEKSLWVEDMEWWFTTRFALPSRYRDKYLTLEIQGINYSGEVYLNGEPLGEMTGMFNPAVFDVSRALRYSGENYLALRLEAPPGSRTEGIFHGRAVEEPYKQLYSIAQFCFGWDWAPHMVPIGIWRPVRLKSGGAGRLGRPRVVTRITGESSAALEISADISNLSGQAGRFSLEGRILAEGSSAEVARFSENCIVESGSVERVAASLTVSPARFWWPHTMGDQPLYRLLLDLAAPEGGGSDRTEVLFGIREIELVENEGGGEILKKELAAETGDIPAQYSLGKVAESYPWTFVVNGRRMYAVGSNWLPLDCRLDLRKDRYEHLIYLAASAGMNLMRVWGGGLYETDEFYDLCDRYGILVWQEFLSNRSVADIDRKRVVEGVREAILRLRNHPSLVLWCGGNEFDPDDRAARALVNELDGVVRELDPGREFHRASPYMGDDHYWGVWHRGEPYTAYRRLRPFRSEAGLGSPPHPDSLRRFIPEGDLWPYNREMWEYHGERIPKRAQMEKMDRYANEYGPAKSLEEYVRNAQLAQAIANQFNVEFCRRHKYVNSGVLIWQYNDCWPAISWSLIDWYGRPKPSYYYLKRAARPVHICADYPRYHWEPGEEFQATVHLINDRPDNLSALRCRAVLFDSEFKRLGGLETTADIGPDRSDEVGALSWEIPSELPSSVFFLHLDLTDSEGRPLSSNLYWLAAGPKGPAADRGDYAGIFAPLDGLPATTLDYETVRRPSPAGPAAGDEIVLTVRNTGSFPAFHVALEAAGLPDGVHLTYSDNYFHLMPGREVAVAIGCRTPSGVAGRCRPGLRLFGWNCPSNEIELDLDLRRRV